MKPIIKDLHEPFMNNDDRWAELWKKICDIETNVGILSGKIDSMGKRLDINTPGKTPDCIVHTHQIADLANDVKVINKFQFKAIGALLVVNALVVPLVIYFASQHIK